jgi:hypothetical protein
MLVDDLLSIFMLAASEEHMRCAINDKGIVFTEREASQSVWGRRAKVLHGHQTAHNGNWRGRQTRVEADVVDVLA